MNRRDASRDDKRASRQVSRSSAQYTAFKNSLRTPEQIAFEQEFAKWENGFSDWKQSWSTHNDKSAYLAYEKNCWKRELRSTEKV